METFKRLNDEGVTIIQVTHSEKNAEYGNRIIQIVDGWIDNPVATEAAGKARRIDRMRFAMSLALVIAAVAGAATLA